MRLIDRFTKENAELKTENKRLKNIPNEILAKLTLAGFQVSEKQTTPFLKLNEVREIFAQFAEKEIKTK